jgi:hypothetical protein
MLTIRKGKKLYRMSLFSVNLKAHLHLQFLLRFSSSDACERVDENSVNRQLACKTKF